MNVETVPAPGEHSLTRSPALDRMRKGAQINCYSNIEYDIVKGSFGYMMHPI